MGGPHDGMKVNIEGSFMTIVLPVILDPFQTYKEGDDPFPRMLMKRSTYKWNFRDDGEIIGEYLNEQ